MVDISYKGGACGVSRWESENDEGMYGKFGMGGTAEAVDREVVEWMKCT